MSGFWQTENPLENMIKKLSLGKKHENYRHPTGTTLVLNELN